MDECILVSLLILFLSDSIDLVVLVKTGPHKGPHKGRRESNIVLVATGRESIIVWWLLALPSGFPPANLIFNPL